jgi:hypothetical protein
MSVNDKHTSLQCYSIYYVIKSLTVQAPGKLECHHKAFINYLIVVMGTLIKGTLTFCFSSTHGSSGINFINILGSQLTTVAR